MRVLRNIPLVLFRSIANLCLNHSLAILLVVLALSILLYFNISNLRLGTNLTDLFGRSDPKWQTLNDYTERFGYGNQLFVIIEATEGSEELAEQMEAAGERLTAEMVSSGYFKYARCGLRDQEILGMARLFAWNFPFFVRPERKRDLEARLEDARIRETVGRATTGLVTPFSSIGSEYFVTDPLGLAELAAPAGGLSGFMDFDLGWGSGDHLFSRDHTALLVVAEPKFPGTNYQRAEDVVRWTRSRIDALSQEEAFKRASLRLTLAGAYVFAEQDRGFIGRNITLVSLVSVFGNLLLCLLVYRRIPVFLMSFIPTCLGLLWTTGLISYYPGELNLISLSFIAILVGLGDDNVIHFFNRVPQEWTEGRALRDAMSRTIDTTGRSIVFCIITAGTATLALATSEFKGLSEFGFVLTVGLVMLLIHTLLTVPALMNLWWSIFPPGAPRRTAFRFLPSLSSASAALVSRYPKAVFAVLAGMSLLALFVFPSLRMDRKVEITRGEENPAVVGQKRLAQKFGIEGTPDVILVEGSRDDVLRRTEGLTSALEDLKKSGMIRSVFSPSQLLPSKESQKSRAAALSAVDLGRAVNVLERSLKEYGFNLDYFAPAIKRYRKLAEGEAEPLSYEDAMEYLPQGILDNSIQKLGPDRYLAAVALQPADPEASAAIPDRTMSELQRKFGPLAEFSYPKISRELQSQIFRDSRRALALTAFGITLIVFLVLRDVRMTILVLAPIVFAIVMTFGILIVAKHPFSFMALTALPLIVGLGIDNGIHLARRYLENRDTDISEILRYSGPALIQSSLTTIVGFGALMISSFEPLAEMGLVTALGVGLALVGVMLLFPASVKVFRIRHPAKQA